MGLGVMDWWIVLLFIVIGIAAFMRVFRRRLEVLTGPWIANELSHHD